MAGGGMGEIPGGGMGEMAGDGMGEIPDGFVCRDIEVV